MACPHNLTDGKAKITPVLWKHKTNAEGHAPIYLRIYASGKTKYKSLSVYIHERTHRQWHVYTPCLRSPQATHHCACGERSGFLQLRHGGP